MIVKTNNQEVLLVNEKINLKTGGSTAVDRLMEAYKFKFKNDLCRHFGITSSTLATWLKRDHFPATLVIQCALETNINLQWLVTGVGNKIKDNCQNHYDIERKLIENGLLVDCDHITFDHKILPKVFKPIAITIGFSTYIIEQATNDLVSGEWLIEMEGKTNIYYLERIPVNRLRITDGDLKAPVECDIKDVKVLGRVIFICNEK